MDLGKMTCWAFTIAVAFVLFMTFSDATKDKEKSISHHIFKFGNAACGLFRVLFERFIEYIMKYDIVYNRLIDFKQGKFYLDGGRLWSGSCSLASSTYESLRASLILCIKEYTTCNECAIVQYDLKKYKDDLAISHSKIEKLEAAKVSKHADRPNTEKEPHGQSERKCYSLTADNAILKEQIKILQNNERLYQSSSEFVLRAEIETLKQSNRTLQYNYNITIQAAKDNKAEINSLLQDRREYQERYQKRHQQNHAEQIEAMQKEVSNTKAAMTKLSTKMEEIQADVKKAPAYVEKERVLNSMGNSWRQALLLVGRFAEGEEIGISMEEYMTTEFAKLAMKAQDAELDSKRDVERAVKAERDSCQKGFETIFLQKVAEAKADAQREYDKQKENYVSQKEFSDHKEQCRKTLLRRIQETKESERVLAREALLCTEIRTRNQCEIQKNNAVATAMLIEQDLRIKATSEARDQWERLRRAEVKAALRVQQYLLNQATTALRSEYDQQIRNIQQNTSRKIDNLIVEHNQALLNQRNEPSQEVVSLKGQHSQEIHDIRSASKKEVADLKSKHKQEIKKMENTSSQDIATLRTKHKEEAQGIKTASSQKIDDLKTQFKQELQDLKTASDKRLAEAKDKYETHILNMPSHHTPATTLPVSFAFGAPTKFSGTPSANNNIFHGVPTAADSHNPFGFAQKKLSDLNAMAEAVREQLFVDEPSMDAEQFISHIKAYFEVGGMWGSGATALIEDVDSLIEKRFIQSIKVRFRYFKATVQPTRDIVPILIDHNHEIKDWVDKQGQKITYLLEGHPMSGDVSTMTRYALDPIMVTVGDRLHSINSLVEKEKDYLDDDVQDAVNDFQAAVASWTEFENNQYEDTSDGFGI